MTENEAAASPTLVALADDLADARVALDEANDIAKQRQSEYDALEATLFDKMEDAGLVSIRTARGLFRLNDLAWASVEDEAAARDWAETHMPELLLLNRQRLSTVVRRALKGEESVPGMEGQALPPGVNFRLSRKISWRRS